jgi:hypothetical protein
VAVRLLVLIAVGSALGIGTGALVIARSQAVDKAAHASGRGANPEPLRPRSERHATHEANRRVLTAAQTQRLVRYAKAVHRCLTRRGVNASAPKKDSKAITIETAEDVGLEALVAITTSCAAPLGEPPKPSSLQAVDSRTIVLSVPKQCLLDPKIEA